MDRPRVVIDLHENDGATLLSRLRVNAADILIHGMAGLKAALGGDDDAPQGITFVPLATPGLQSLMGETRRLVLEGRSVTVTYCAPSGRFSFEGTDAGSFESFQDRVLTQFGRDLS